MTPADTPDIVERLKADQLIADLTEFLWDAEDFGLPIDPLKACRLVGKALHALRAAQPPQASDEGGAVEGQKLADTYRQGPSPRRLPRHHRGACAMTSNTRALDASGDLATTLRNDAAAVRRGGYVGSGEAFARRLELAAEALALLAEAEKVLEPFARYAELDGDEFTNPMICGMSTEDGDADVYLANFRAARAFAAKLHEAREG